MIIWEGKSVFGGIAIGPVALFEKREESVKRYSIKNVEWEKERFEKAKVKAKEELAILYKKALREVGETNAMIFDVHQMMLDDLDYVESILNMIELQRVNAEFAVASTGDNFSRMFAAMDDAYMKERAADVRDISNRVIRILQGREAEENAGDEPVILFAEDLAPSETVLLDKSKVLSFVTRYGSANSHTSILARTMNIPALVGVEYTEGQEGKMAIVDGFEGKIYVDPDDKTLTHYKMLQEEEENKKKLLQNLKGKETATRDGRKIKLYANIGSVGDVAEALKNDAGGIGLFRSEFLYLGRKTFPEEEEQFKAYKTVAENMSGRKVIIRTLDIGADKKAEYFKLGAEENPAMGYRAIRICLTEPEIFKTQLRALYRASHYGAVSIMIPMIISVREIRQVKEYVSDVKKELEQQGIPYGPVELGIMIETPAAVLISDLLAKEVDFFSIGTNDLIQYTLAVDRQNPKLDNFYDAHHEAILRMIQMVIENGHREGCWVGICGELAADTTLTKKFVDMGLDELSVTPSMVLKVREAVRSI